MTTTPSRIRHRPACRHWFGAQTAYADRDWLKHLKRITAVIAFGFGWNEMFYFCFISLFI